MLDFSIFLGAGPVQDRSVSVRRSLYPGRARNYGLLSEFPSIEPIKVLIYFSIPTIEWRRIDIHSDESRLNNPDELYSDTKENSDDSKEEIVPENPKINTGNTDDVIELTSEDMERIEKRFEERRARMISVRDPRTKTEKNAKTWDRTNKILKISDRFGPVGPRNR